MADTNTQFRVNIGPVGREYDGIKQDNGNYAVLGIPLFLPTERGGKKFDSQWMSQTVQFHSKQQNERQHAPSLHWDHHGKGPDEKHNHGQVQNIRLGKLDGQDCIFGDFVNVPEDIYEMMKDGRLPHVSVELSKEYPNRISSVALLPSAGPYFTLPNIRVKDRFQASGALCFENSTAIEVIRKIDTPEKQVIFQEDEEEEEETVEGEEEAEESSEEEESEEESSDDDQEKRIANLEKEVSEIKAMMKGEDEDKETQPPVAQPESEGDEEMEGKHEKENEMAENTDKFEELKKEFKDYKERTNKELQKFKDQYFRAKLDSQVEKAISFANEQGRRFDEDEKREEWRNFILEHGPKAGEKYIDGQIKEMPTYTGLGSNRTYASTQPFSDVNEQFSDEPIEIQQAAKEADRVYREDPGYFQTLGWSHEEWVKTEVERVKAENNGQF